MLKQLEQRCSSPLCQRMVQYGYLIRLDRPIGTYLLLWPTLWALWIAADGLPNWLVLLVFVAGVFLMRSAGCAINDFADRHIDKHVARTKDRPLTAGRISSKEALGVFVVLALLAFALVWLLNEKTRWLSLGGVALAASYPFMKRFHYFPQVHLGAAFGWAIPMAFTAITNEWPPTHAWLLFTATLLWTTAYDTMYGMADRMDDIKLGVKSTAILFGEFDKLMVGFLQALFLLSMLMVGNHIEAGWAFYTGLGVAAALMAYQQLLIMERAPAFCLRAFLNNHWLGMAVFIGITVDYLLR